MAIGCNPGNFEDVSLAQAEDTATQVLVGQYAGIATWSINRDTDHRYGWHKQAQIDELKLKSLNFDVDES